MAACGVWEPAAVGAQRAPHARCGALRAGRVDGSCGLLARRGPAGKPAVSEEAGAWAHCQCELSHGREQRNKTRSPTPVFSIYVILLQATKDHSVAETFCGILYRANYISLSILHIKHASPPLCFLQRLPCCMGSHRCGAHTNDPLAVLVLPGLVARLAWLGWGGRDARQQEGKHTPCMGAIPREPWTTSAIVGHQRCGRSPAFTSSA